MTPLILALGICHKDCQQAERWLRHLDAITPRSGEDHRLVITGTQAISPAYWNIIRRTGPIHRMHIEYVRLADANEDGYPKSASHLFLKTMEHCEKNYPESPVLWLETDTLPMRTGWAHEIEWEYRQCGQPFMGHIERGHGPAHMAGCGVYCANWRVKAPLLASVLDAPDIFWGKGRGQAFDTYAAPEIVPQAAPAKTIQQIWRPVLPVTRQWLQHFVRPATALFHQVKDGSGFKAVRK